VKGYIFEQFTLQKAKQFNFLLQMWGDKFVLVNKKNVCSGRGCL